MHESQGCYLKRGCQIAKGKKAVDREKGCQTAKTKLKKNKACAHHGVGSRCSLRVGCCRRSRRCSSLPWVVAAGCVLCAVGRAWVWGVAAGCGGRGWVPGLWFLLEFGERSRAKREISALSATVVFSQAQCMTGAKLKSTYSPLARGWR